MKKKPFLLKQEMKVLYIFIAAILLSFSFFEYGFGYENILLLYIVAIVLIIMETRSFIYGTVIASLYVLVFNFFFTEPRFTFIISDQTYIITLAIFLIVSFLISSIMRKLHVQATRAITNEKRINLLYNTTKGLLYLKTTEKVSNYFLKIIQETMEIDTAVYLKSNGYYTSLIKDFTIDNYTDIINDCIKSKNMCGKTTKYHNNIPFLVIPLSSKKDHNGALIIDIREKSLSTNELDLIQALSSLLIIVLDREKSADEEEKARLEIENEKFKNLILRSISHDLRTPLTSILTGSSFLMNSVGKLDQDTEEEVLREIVSEVDKMKLFLENLLNLTKLQDQEIKLKIKKEAIDEIINESISRVKNHLGKRVIKISASKEVIIAKLDAQLMVQVITNILQNAIQHTNEDTKIDVSYYQNQGNVIIEIADNGGGIKNKNINQIFEDFTTLPTKAGDKYRGIGIGLSLSKSVVEKHKGSIEAKNNQQGGATFIISLPL